MKKLKYMRKLKPVKINLWYFTCKGIIWPMLFQSCSANWNHFGFSSTVSQHHHVLKPAMSHQHLVNNTHERESECERNLTCTCVIYKTNVKGTNLFFFNFLSWFNHGIFLYYDYLHQAMNKASFMFNHSQYLESGFRYHICNHSWRCVVLWITSGFVQSFLFFLDIDQLNSLVYLCIAHHFSF